MEVCESDCEGKKCGNCCYYEEGHEDDDAVDAVDVVDAVAAAVDVELVAVELAAVAVAVVAVVVVGVGCQKQGRIQGMVCC